MIKRIVNILFLLGFIFSTTGVFISSHSCNMNLCKVESNCCEKDNSNCCHTEFKFFKLNNDFISIGDNKTEISLLKITSLFQNIIINEIGDFSFEKFIINSSPPYIAGRLSYLQVFRI